MERRTNETNDLLLGINLRDLSLVHLDVPLEVPRQEPRRLQYRSCRQRSNGYRGKERTEEEVVPRTDDHLSRVTESAPARSLQMHATYNIVSLVVQVLQERSPSPSVPQHDHRRETGIVRELHTGVPDLSHVVHDIGDSSNERNEHGAGKVPQSMRLLLGSLGRGWRESSAGCAGRGSRKDRRDEGRGGEGRGEAGGRRG
jgi:hypothetical protein